ncbi:hypothetical protein SLT67_07680 [Paenibacillus illinoisensis]|uniref:hypothetical protein n=1 Tax=Paenibacillus illinoisensis TaxID=59845 RepID=UPI003CEB8C1F
MKSMQQYMGTERLEGFSQAIQAISDEANMVCKGLFSVRKEVGADNEWEVTAYGKKVLISSDEISRILNIGNNTNLKEKFKELVAWKLRAVNRAIL